MLGRTPTDSETSECERFFDDMAAHCTRESQPDGSEKRIRGPLCSVDPEPQRLHNHPIGVNEDEPLRSRNLIPSATPRIPERRAWASEALRSAACFAAMACASELVQWMPPDGLPHFAPKAKSVIWLFMRGGVSHMESFDPKPALNKYAGQSIADTPFADVQSPEKLKKVRVVVVNDANGQQRNKTLSAAGRLQKVRPKRDRSQRLVSAHRFANR